MKILLSGKLVDLRAWSNMLRFARYNVCVETCVLCIFPRSLVVIPEIRKPRAKSKRISDAEGFAKETTHARARLMLSIPMDSRKELYRLGQSEFSENVILKAKVQNFEKRIPHSEKQPQASMAIGWLGGSNVTAASGAPVIRVPFGVPIVHDERFARVFVQVPEKCGI
jgi:hypothetical protein